VAFMVNVGPQGGDRGAMNYERYHGRFAMNHLSRFKLKTF
jgi:hypothetical protein